MARPRSAAFAINRETIVRTAARLFAQAGYPGTTMNDIARECGISKPLLYHYVSDKYQVLLEICDSHVTRLEALVAVIDALPLPPEQRLRLLIARFVEEYAEARHDHGVLTQDVKFLTDTDRAHVLEKERHVVDAFARSIAAARPELKQAALDKPLTMLLFGMMNWMFTWLRPHGTLSHEQMAPVVADLFLGGLAAVRPPAPKPPVDPSAPPSPKHSSLTLS